MPLPAGASLAFTKGATGRPQKKAHCFLHLGPVASRTVNWKTRSQAPQEQGLPQGFSPSCRILMSCKGPWSRKPEASLGHRLRSLPRQCFSNCGLRTHSVGADLTPGGSHTTSNENWAREDQTPNCLKPCLRTRQLPVALQRAEHLQFASWRK